MEPLTALEVLAQRPADLPAPLAAFVLTSTFVFSLCWGSFLNVVIARVPAGVSVVRPRSHCPTCGQQISGFDNIPVLSWLALRGRCRMCKAAISPRYPVVELLIGLAGLACVVRFGVTIEAVELFAFIAILTAISFIDVDTWTVPHPMWIALIASGLLFAAIEARIADDASVLIDRVIGGVGAALLLAAVVVTATAALRKLGRIPPGETAMGWGDPLILAGIGSYLGYRTLPLVLFLSSVQGAAVGVVLWKLGKLRGDAPVSQEDDWTPPKGALPFGPFLALGALEVAFFGDAMLAHLVPLLRAE